MTRRRASYLHQGCRNIVNFFAEILTATSFTAANNMVSRMVKLGVLVEATGYRRNRLFRYQAYIDLFGEGGKTKSEKVP